MLRWAAVLLAGCVVTSCSGVSADEHERVIEQLARAEQLNSSIQQELSEQASSAEEMRSQIEALETELSDASQQVQSMGEQLATSRETVQELRGLLGSSGDCGAYRGVVCQGYVTDAAGVLVQRDTLEATVAAVVDRYGHEIVIVLVPTTGGLGIETFSNELGNSWGVGDKARQDGLVVLVDIGSAETWVTSGPGLDLGRQHGEIASAGSRFFAAGAWDSGVEAILNALIGTFPLEA